MTTDSAAAAMKNFEGDDEEAELKAGLEAMLDEADAQKKAMDEKTRVQEVKKVIDNLGILATKEELAEAIKNLTKRQDKFEALILKAKARGKAQIQNEEALQDSELKKLVKGTPMDGIF